MIWPNTKGPKELSTMSFLLIMLIMKCIEISDIFSKMRKNRNKTITIIQNPPKSFTMLMCLLTFYPSNANMKFECV